MSKVDKFGRSFRGGNLIRGSKSGPKGDGFLLDGDGNYLVSNKRIRQLQDPEDDADAVNKQWSEAKLKQIQEKWKDAMNFGELCMDKIRDLESRSIRLENRLEDLGKAMGKSIASLSEYPMELENRIEKLEKKCQEPSQVWVQAKGPDDKIYTVVNTNVRPSTEKK